MKKFAIAVVAAALTAVSCDKEPSKAEYTLLWNYDRNVSELIIWECDDYGSKLASHVLKDIERGESFSYAAVPEADKIKIYFETARNSLGISADYWVQQVFLLKGGENTLITIDGGTVVGYDEP